MSELEDYRAARAGETHNKQNNMVLISTHNHDISELMCTSSEYNQRRAPSTHSY